MLFIYLLIAEHPAYSMPNLESWFFQTLVQVFSEQYKKERVVDMLTEVTELKIYSHRIIQGQGGGILLHPDPGPGVE